MNEVDVEDEEDEEEEEEARVSTSLLSLFFNYLDNRFELKKICHYEQKKFISIPNYIDCKTFDK